MLCVWVNKCVCLCVFFLTCDHPFSDFSHDPPIYRVGWIKLKYFFYICPDGSFLTQRQANERTMTTTTLATNYWTTTAAATAVTAPVKKQHTPGFKLTEEERSKKHDLHQYGLCCSCDNGLDDRADFICDKAGLMCNACCDYYTGADGYWRPEDMWPMTMYVWYDQKNKTKNMVYGSVCVFFRDMWPIKLKCFFTFFVIAWIHTSDKTWLVLSVDSMLANFVDLLVSSGLRNLSVLLFAESSSFIATGKNFLLTRSRLIFIRSFVSMSRMLCVLLTATPTLPKIISREFVLVGSVFHLSPLFFWNFNNATVLHHWSAVHPPLMIPCLPMVSCRIQSTMRLPVKSLGFITIIPAVTATSFLPFPAHVLSHLGAVASIVALDLPTKSTSIGFPNVSVSVMVLVKKSSFVLHVLIIIKYWEVCVTHYGFYLVSKSITYGIYWRWGLPSFFYFLILMFERNLSAFPFSNFQTFIFQPFHFLSDSDVRQIFDGSDLIVREIYILSFDLYVPHHTTLPYHPRLFSLSTQSLRSFRRFAGPFLRRLCPDHPLS